MQYFFYGNPGFSCGCTESLSFCDRLLRRKRRVRSTSAALSDVHCAALSFSWVCSLSSVSSCLSQLEVVVLTWKEGTDSAGTGVGAGDVCHHAAHLVGTSFGDTRHGNLASRREARSALKPRTVEVTSHRLSPSLSESPFRLPRAQACINISAT